MLYGGLIVDNTYQVCDEIGSGGMGVIYLAYHLRLNKYVVMKKIKNPRAEIAFLRNEVDILKSLHHTFLPQVYDFISYDGDQYTIIDYIEGYDLKYYIDNRIEITEGQLIKWLRQLCEVLCYLHSHNPRILHTDIKPANIIVQPNGDICLIDFGISMLGNTDIKGISYRYSSPEQNYNVTCINSGNYGSIIELDERTDIYSLGATFYQLLTLTEPSCLYQLPPVEGNLRLSISEPLMKIIDKSVVYDREKRFSTVSEILRALDNMFKLNSRYKLYVAVQVIASILSCLVIMLGAFLIVDSLNNGIKASFETDYNIYLSALKSGDIDLALDTAKNLINSTEYSTMMDDSKTAEVYHGLGDCYYYSSDYYNAERCYGEAVKLANAYDRGEILYRDYALAMIENGKLAEADGVLTELNMLYPDSASGYLISAQLKSRGGQEQEAMQLVEEALQRAWDDNTRYTAYLLQGDLYMRSSDLDGAINSYLAAKMSEENAIVLRRLGLAQLKSATASRNTAMYGDALISYRTIFENYSPQEDDVFNLAQCYLLSGEASGTQKCIDVLTEYTKLHPESCKSYILMAIASDAAGDGKTAEYCRAASWAYYQLSDEEKKLIDAESLNQIKMLYQKYTKEVW